MSVAPPLAPGFPVTPRQPSVVALEANHNVQAALNSKSQSALRFFLSSLQTAAGWYWRWGALFVTLLTGIQHGFVQPQHARIVA
jgi:hypothetical protein